MEVRILKNSYSYSEVLDIIDNMEVKYKEMLPRKLMDFLNENKNLEYKKHVEAGNGIKRPKKQFQRI